MRKLFFFAAAAAMLTTACSKDEAPEASGAAESVVTFTVTAPNIGTRAASTYGNGHAVNKLHYAVYLDGQATPLISASEVDAFADDALEDKVSLTLANGKSYDILFWADNDTAPYDVNWNAQTVTINNASLAAQNENMDAFFKKIDIDNVQGPINQPVELKRPFAQLNIATKDIDAAEAAGVVVGQTAVTVKAYKTLNLASGVVSGQDDFTYNMAAIPTDTQITATGTQYDLLSMNYLLVNAQELVDVKFSYADAQGNAIDNATFEAVPVERNHKTHIVGDLLTSAAEFQVEIKEGFDQPDNVADDLIIAAALGGEVTLTEDVVLNQPLNIQANMVLNMNGHTISGAIEKGDGAIVNVAQGVSAKLIDGTIKNTAENGDAAINNEGDLVLNGVTIEGAPLADGGYSAYALISSGKMTIEEGTNISADRGSIKLSGAGETVINGGTFTNNDIGSRTLTSHVVDVEDGGTHKLTINGGTFQHLHAATSGGVVICNRTTGTVYVNGGNFSGGNYYGDDNLSDYGYGGTFAVTGGTYSAKPATKYIADGYKAEEKDGKYYVVAEGVAVAKDAAEVAAAIANGDEVVLVNDITYSSAINKDANIDLNGNTFEATGTINLSNNADLTMVGGSYVVNSTYGHVDVRPSTAEGSVVTYENVDFSFNKLGPTYGPSTNRLGSVVEVCATATDANTVIKFKNCTFDNAQILFEGLSGTVGTFEAEFDGCTFNALTSSAPIYVQNYVKGSIKVTNCTFNLTCTSNTASAISVSSSSSTAVTVTAVNNTLNAVAATPYTFDPSKGETEVHNIKVNGTVNTAKFISISGTTSSATETGTTKTGIAL